MPWIPGTTSSALVRIIGLKIYISRSIPSTSSGLTFGNLGSLTAAEAAMSITVCPREPVPVKWPIQPLSKPSFLRVTKAPPSLSKTSPDGTSGSGFPDAAASTDLLARSSIPFLQAESVISEPPLRCNRQNTLQQSFCPRSRLLMYPT